MNQTKELGTIHSIPVRRVTRRIPRSVRRVPTYRVLFLGSKNFLLPTFFKKFLSTPKNDFSSKNTLKPLKKISPLRGDFSYFSPQT